MVQPCQVYKQWNIISIDNQQSINIGVFNFGELEFDGDVDFGRTGGGAGVEQGFDVHFHLFVEQLVDVVRVNRHAAQFVVQDQDYLDLVEGQAVLVVVEVAAFLGQAFQGVGLLEPELIPVDFVDVVVAVLFFFVHEDAAAPVE